jgi:hypothetical protein
MIAHRTNILMFVRIFPLARTGWDGIEGKPALRKPLARCKGAAGDFEAYAVDDRLYESHPCSLVQLEMETQRRPQRLWSSRRAMRRRRRKRAVTDNCSRSKAKRKGE